MSHFAPTVFVVDDDEAMRQSLRWLIESEGLPVIAFASALDFLDSCDPCRPGCLVLDIQMPGMSGMDLLEVLPSHRITLPVVMITGHGNIPMAVRAIKNGALDFIQKPFDDEELLCCIRRLLQQDANERQSRLHADRTRALVAALTPREHQLMGLLVAGKSNKGIASEMAISARTVEVHRARIMQKLQVKSVVELVQLIYVADLLQGG